MRLIRVALDVPLPRLFDYLLAEAADTGVSAAGTATATAAASSASAVAAMVDGELAPCLGRLVRVPFGSSHKIGVVVAEPATTEQPADKLKTAELIPAAPRLPADWLELCRFCARYYHYPLGQVVAFALPPLLRQGKLPRLLKRKKVDTAIDPTAGTSGETATPVSFHAATPEQQAAIDAIVNATLSGGFATFLLHGVTGSGKTEVYLQAIAAVLADGGQALMLVPEIALTPQLEARVSARFPDACVVSAHSGVADAARARAFLAAHGGTADIVLGTRLSVFMPLPRLKLIVVDEEHDASFKQQEGLRYSARDVAIFRAKQRAIPIVLGSATPSLETYHHATRERAGRYRKLDLPLRAVAAAMPTVATVDTRKQKLQDGLSEELVAAVSERLQRGEQSLLFLNRRGYAPVLACPACGWISQCHRCAANMVVHLAARSGHGAGGASACLRCHHCGLETTIPRHCPDCGNLDIQPFGRGTQRLEERLVALFPEARILRIDRDSADSPKKWQTLLDSIYAGEVDILVGTQMLAKGHDFPKLTLVGAVGADTSLFAVDFRAPERLFAQLMQVGGRSGRHDLPGTVLIQTEHPDHPLFRALIEHDYAAFAAAQLAERDAAGFPPFSFQAMLRADAPTLAMALDFLHVAVSSAPTFSAVMLYDPVPMRLERLKNRERAQLLIESRSRPAVQAFLSAWLEVLHSIKTSRELRWHIDVDPLEY